MSEMVSGSNFIRNNVLSQVGDKVDGHSHNFDHTTFARKGWFLIRRRGPGGEHVVNQFASPEHSELRRLKAKYEPNSVLRPVRYPDVIDQDGRPHFQLDWIPQGVAVPDGAEEILYQPKLWFRLIEAGVEHEIVALTPDSQFDCIFSHRTPDGEPVANVTGWMEAYQ